MTAHRRPPPRRAAHIRHTSLSRLMADRARAERAQGQNPETEQTTQIDLGEVAGLALGGLGEALSKAARALSEGANEAAESMRRQFETKDGKPGDIVFGYRVKVGLDEVVAEPFGNVHPDDYAAPVDDARQPILDIHDEPTEVRIIAEMPGVGPDQVRISIDGDIASLTTAEGAPAYATTLDLPAAVIAEPSITGANGIIDIRLPKQES